MKIYAVSAFVLLASLPSLAHAGACSYQGYHKKLGILDRKIEIARQYGNHWQVHGLERKRKRIAERCGEAGRPDIRDSAKARREVAEAKAKLDYAQSIGDPDKIANARRKLLDKQEKLARWEHGAAHAE